MPTVCLNNCLDTSRKRNYKYVFFPLLNAYRKSSSPSSTESSCQWIFDIIVVKCCKITFTVLQVLSHAHCIFLFFFLHAHLQRETGKRRPTQADTVNLGLTIFTPLRHAKYYRCSVTNRPTPSEYVPPAKQFRVSNHRRHWFEQEALQVS